MTCIKSGMSSSSHVCHHSRLMILPSSAVGFCCHCACHFCSVSEARVAVNESMSQYSGQIGLLLGNIAGNSISSHWSALGSFACASINLPVKSFTLHLVITITIAPPGCRRCLGPEVYHSYALSNAVSDSASCSECGSSMINKSAPRPVILEPTPAAKYSPPLFVSQRPAALLSADIATSSKTC